MRADDFLLSGATDTAPVFYEAAALGAGAAINGEAIICQEKDHARFYYSRETLSKGKDALLATSNSSLSREFRLWLNKWNSLDDELYSIASFQCADWRRSWKKLHSLSRSLFVHAYKVEYLDNFSEEVKEIVCDILSKSGIPLHNADLMIAPEEPALTQRMSLDIQKLKKQKNLFPKILRKYWFAEGTWNGGSMLDAPALKKKVKENKKLTIDFLSIKRLHARYDRLLDRSSLGIIKNLRLLSLWRDERKAVIQKIAVAHSSVVEQASSELGMNSRIFSFLCYQEIGMVRKMLPVLKRRAQSHVFVIKNGGRASEILTGKAAASFITEFNRARRVAEIKGFSASPGKALGFVKIIVSPSDFHKFRPGNVLVTTMTRPEFVPLAHKACAIVTDEGGLTSHAAIISREMKKPCIINTKNATKVLKDNYYVSVDADRGIVRVIR